MSEVKVQLERGREIKSDCYRSADSAAAPDFGQMRQQPPASSSLVHPAVYCTVLDIHRDYCARQYPIFAVAPWREQPQTRPTTMASRKPQVR